MSGNAKLCPTCTTQSYIVAGPTAWGLYTDFIFGPGPVLYCYAGHFSIPTNYQPPSPNAPMCGAKQSGSDINMDLQTVGETIPIAGTDFSLNYSSLWSANRTSDYEIRVPLSGNPVDPNVSDFNYSTSILSTVVDSGSIANTINQTYVYQWDGKDSGGTPVLGSVEATTTITPVGVTVTIPIVGAVGTVKATLLGFGGWLPSNYHFYDHARKTLYRGDGSTRVVGSLTSGSNFLVPEEDGSVVFEFDSAGRHLYTRSGLLGTTLATFNYTSNLLTSVTEPFSRTTTFTRDGSGNLTSITSPDGVVTTTTITGGLLTAVESPMNEIYAMTYGSGSDLLKTFTKPEGQVSTFTYDGQGLVTNDSHSGGYNFTVSRTNTGPNTYTMVHTTGLGKTSTSYVTNSLNGVDSGVYSRSDYLPGSVVNSVNQSNTASVSYEREGTNRSISFASAARFPGLLQIPQTRTVGARSVYTSQSVSLGTPGDQFSVNTLTTTQTLNSKNTVTVFYGSSNSFITTSPEGRVRSSTIDSYERPTSNQWASDDAVSYSYTNDKLTGVTQNARSTTLTYGTSSGLLSSVTNALNETTAFTYDNSRRLTYITYPDLRAIQFSYDDNGNVTGITPPGRSVHSFSMNGHELLGTYSPPTLPGVSVVNTGYTYNNDKQITQITRPDGQTIAFNYSGGVLSSLTTPDGTFTYSFDAGSERHYSINTPSSVSHYMSYTSGKLTYDQHSDSSGWLGTYTATYNSLEQLSSQSIALSGTTATMNYTYDDDELLESAGDLTVTRGSASGRIDSTALGSVTDAWTYNSYGELTGYSASYGTTPLMSYTLTRDLLGRVDTLSETVQGTSSYYQYAYDSSGRLTTVDKGSAAYSSYTYDDNSNRTYGTTSNVAFTAVVDAQDRLTDYNLFDYAYSDNGELQSKVNTLTTETTTYVYDVLGNLKSVTLPSTDVITYQPDGYGRRIVRKLNGTVTSKYMYNGSQLIAELNSSNGLKAAFIYGTKRHVPDYMIAASGAKYRIVTDHLGSVRLVVKVSDGSIAQVLEYNDLGRVMTDTNPGFQPFGFAGGLYDSDAKLVKFGARDYDPETGRWTSKDPILFRGGDTNLYGYVMNDPINFIDPTGLFLSGDQISGMIGGAIGGAAAGAYYGTYVNPGFGTGFGALAGGLGGAVFGGVMGPHVGGLLDQANASPFGPPRSEPPLLPPPFQPPANSGPPRCQ